jgi:hypothetical protein
MPYKELGGKLRYEPSDHDWQLRISIDPAILIANLNANKIVEIESILNEVLTKYLVSSKIFLLPDSQSLYDGEYDGTTSRHGKDRTQCGKEICIYLPNTSHASTTQCYKEMLLELWSRFQKSGIPLLSIPIPGDKKIICSGSPTPFSITSSTERKEWRDKHGILFKKFIGWDTEHPILKVNITESDLKYYDIQLDHINITKINRAYFKNHQNMAIQRLHDDIKNICEQQLSYKEILYNSDLSNIKHKIAEYNNKIEHIAVDEKKEFTKNFKKEINEEISNDRNFQRICNDYPHNSDSAFSNHPAIGVLKRRPDLLDEKQIDESILQLINDYAQGINAIKSDFSNHANLDANHQVAIQVDWQRYIPDYNLDLCNKLIENNPALMQTVYRRIILLERERIEHEEFKRKWLESHYKNNEIHGKFKYFSEEIKIMEYSKHDPILTNSLKSLYNKLEDEIFSHAKCDLNKTPYFIVIDHFLSLAEKINSGQNYNLEEVTTFGMSLDNQLNNLPISIGLKTTICGVIGVLVGATIGAAIGTALTFWGGGFGALPATIIGASIGSSLIIGGISGAAIGFFNAKKNILIQHTMRANDLNNIRQEIDAVHLTLRAGILT